MKELQFLAIDLKQENQKSRLNEFLEKDEHFTVYQRLYLELLPSQSSLLKAWGVYCRDELVGSVVKCVHRGFIFAQDKNVASSIISALVDKWDLPQAVFFEANQSEEKVFSDINEYWQELSTMSYEHLYLQNDRYKSPYPDAGKNSKIRLATTEDIGVLSSLLKETDMFPTDPELIRLQILLGRIYVFDHGDRISTVVGASVVGDQTAMIDITFSTEVARGRGEFFDLGCALMNDLVEEGLNVYCYTVHPAVKKLASMMGFQLVGNYFLTKVKKLKSIPNELV